MSRAPVTFAMVGSGWRADFFMKLARLLPGHLLPVAVAVRRAESVDAVGRRWEIPAYLDVEEGIQRHRPDFVITSVPPEVTSVVLESIVATGTPVLAETPPAADLSGLHRLWEQVGHTELVQVAEQYLRMPTHAVRAELVRRGIIGEPTGVQVSSTHDYHALSVIRGMLGIAHKPATVSASRFSAPLVDPLSRSGWTGEAEPKRASTVIASLDFGDVSALYDFTDNQWHNQLRHRRIVVRGSHGEIVDDKVVRLTGPQTIVRSQIMRSQLGYELNLDGYDTEHLSFDGEVIWRNPFIGLRLMDEEIAIGAIMLEMADWCRGSGPPPYPLSGACEDQYLSLVIHESARRAKPLRTEAQPWSSSLPQETWSGVSGS